jgi:hypothetical protein
LVIDSLFWIHKSRNNGWSSVEVVIYLPSLDIPCAFDHVGKHVFEDSISFYFFSQLYAKMENIPLDSNLVILIFNSMQKRNTCELSYATLLYTDNLWVTQHQIHISTSSSQYNCYRTSGISLIFVQWFSTFLRMSSGRFLDLERRRRHDRRFEERHPLLLRDVAEATD